METFQIRTDLALEARESVNEEESKLRGVSVDEHYEEETDIRITKVTIDTKNAEKTLGKPMGVYVTMEAPAMVEPDDDYHREISEALAEELLKMMPGEAEELSVLIVGLGNREVTADALGPQVVDNLLITRHVVRAYGKAAYNCTRMNLVSSIEPGVMAKTGMETAEIISGVVKETQPDVLKIEPYDPDHQYRHSARLRRGQSPQCPDRRDPGRTGNCHRDPHGGGCRHDCGRCTGEADERGKGVRCGQIYGTAPHGFCRTEQYVYDRKGYRFCDQTGQLHGLRGNQYCHGKKLGVTAYI